MKNICALILLVLSAAGCSVVDSSSKYSHSAELGIRAYKTNKPALAVVLLKPGYFSYLRQSTSDYLSDVNFSEEVFDSVVDHLIVSSWESGDEELHNYLLKHHGADLHDDTKPKGEFIGRYGRVRINQIWSCIELELKDEALLDAAKCWRAVGNKDRSLDNFKAHYIYQGMGRTESY
jgi:hypothetical protein